MKKKTPLTPPSVRIIGLDPGFGRVGWGVIEARAHSLVPIACGCIETTPNSPLAGRLKDIAIELRRIIKKHAPAIAGMETLYFAKNVTTGIDVGHARGVMMLILAEAGLPIHECTPLEVKQAVTGYGKADKIQVQAVVSMHLGLKNKRLQDDAADGFAVAITTAAMARNAL